MKNKNINTTKDISQDVWTIHIPPIPAKLVSAAKEYKATSVARILNYAANLQNYCNRIVYSLRGQIELQNIHSKKFSIQKLLKDTIS
ncbi:putative signal transduction histidine kinase [Orientia tsutsugamushi str. Sido]|nr:putative signal transduction histidine kinase [Orientia tsutsugamushi str. Sido]